MYVPQNHKKNKILNIPPGSATSQQKAMVKKAQEEKKQVMQKEEQTKYIDEHVNQRVREGLQLILSRIQVFIEDQIKVKVSDEVATQMRSVRKEMESQRSSRKCSPKSPKKLFDEDLPKRKKSPPRGILKSEKV